MDWKWIFDGKEKVWSAAALLVTGIVVGSVAGPDFALEGSIYSNDSQGSEIRVGALRHVQPIVDSLGISLGFAASCPYEDQSDGFGGQKGSCSFECPGPAGTFTVSVEADDRDAAVSGSGSCGQHDAHCTGAKSCKAAMSYKGEAVGACSGDSDEYVDSGLYINCYANAEDEPGDPNQPNRPPICVVTKPVPVCVANDIVPASETKSALSLCYFVTCSYGDGVFTMSSEAPGISLAVVDGFAAGAVCGADGTCHLIRPTVTVTDAGLRVFA